MIQATVSLGGLNTVTKELQSFATPVAVNTDKMLRSIATSLCALIRTRVHEDGLNSKGAPIGVYSPAYLKQREKRGLLPDKKVVLAYTLEMQKDFGIGATAPTPLSEGGYGLGFKNPDNAKKAEWNRERYGDFYQTTKQERELALKIAARFIENAFKGKV